MAKWTEERRKRQAEAIRRWKPWEKSTGPKTEAGKERSKLNAFHGSIVREAETLIRFNEAFLQQFALLSQVEAAQKRKKRELLKALAPQDDEP